MLFAVDFDSGDRIQFYLIPDSGGTTPSIIVSNDGVELLRLESNAHRPETIKSGRHATGQCGFLLDTDVLPELSSLPNLEIAEADSKLMIYRRPRPTFKPMKVFRLETHLLPLWRFDDALNGNFQYWFKGVDRFGLETTNQTFNLKDGGSSYASGRLYMRHVEKFVARGMKAIAIVRDPYDELAERLIILKNVGEQKTDLLGPRDAMLFENAMAEIAEIATFDEAACKRFFKRAPLEVMTTLSSPFVRLLTVSNPHDPPPQSCVGLSLQMLAEFAALGLRSEPEEFSIAVADILDLEAAALPVMREFAKVSELGNILRQIREAESVLEQDLEVFHHMKQAFGSAQPQVQPSA